MATPTVRHRENGSDDGDLPHNPSKDWTAGPFSSVSTVETIVVGSERVYAGTSPDEDSERPSTVALDRNDGSVVWRSPVEGGPLALYDGTLYTVAPQDGDGVVVALDAATGTEQWRSTHPADIVQVLPTAETVFSEDGTEFGIAALDASSGHRRWAIQHFEGGVALGDGALFGAPDDVVRYAPRRVSDVVFRSPPPIAWRYDCELEYMALTVGGDTLLVSSTVDYPNTDARCLHAVDLRDGTRRWRAVPGPEQLERTPVRTFPVAVADGTVFHQLRRGHSYAVVARTLVDGTEQWRVGLKNRVTDIAVASETLFVAQAPDPQTDGWWTGVRAFDRDGNERWAKRIWPGVYSIAPVEDTMFVGDGGGRVVAFS